MGMISSLRQNLGDIEFAMDKTRFLTADAFRNYVWQVFLRILQNTPQSSGRAVANWNISANSPDFTVYSQGGKIEYVSGDNFDKMHSTQGARGFGRLESHRSQGFPEFIEVAKRRNKVKLYGVGGGPRLGFKRGGITYNDRVFISNGVEGTSDDGANIESYLSDLQNPGYAARRLRAVNLPYENAQESVIVVSTKTGRVGISLPQVFDRGFKL